MWHKISPRKARKGELREGKKKSPLGPMMRCPAAEAGRGAEAYDDEGGTFGVFAVTGTSKTRKSSRDLP
jgi:hypothetical protein